MADVLCTVKLRTPNSFDSNCYVAVRQEVYSFGGRSNDCYLSVHVFNTVSLKWTKAFPRDDTCYMDNPEVPRMHWVHKGVLVDNVIYIWGGQNDNVLYAFDVDTHTWINTEVSGTVPEARIHHSTCVSGKVIYIHGGKTLTGAVWGARATNDVYKLDTSTMVWSLIETRGTEPSVSSGHSATLIGTKMFVFGVQNGMDDVGYIRVFDTETHHWLSTPSAQPVPMQGRGRGHSAFAYNGELYICRSDTDDQLDLCKINPETLSWKKVKFKRLSVVPNRCFVVGDRVVIYGYDYVSPGHGEHVYILDFNPSLQTLCKLSVLRYDLDQSGLPHHIREELAAMTRTEDHTSRSNVIAERSL